ncbi:amidohydrolase family protein [Acinetobacter baumannii]
MNGAGENLTWSAGTLKTSMSHVPIYQKKWKVNSEAIVEHLAEKKWPFRIHATYDESISRLLNVFERVNSKQPFATRFIIDHAETVSERNIERIGALGGGIAIQHRMAYQGEIFVKTLWCRSCPSNATSQENVRTRCTCGCGNGCDSFASYNPWVCLYWLTTGKTVGGLPLYDEKFIRSSNRPQTLDERFGLVLR